MLSIIHFNETSHHHIQMSGPPTLPAAFLCFSPVLCGEFQPGPVCGETASAGKGDGGRLLHDARWMGGQRSLPTAGAMTAAQQSERPSVGLVLLDSSGFCQPARESP